jgi:predicted RNA-binding Zn-ribbon protein involved in translation (DUF1610 family)
MKPICPRCGAIVSRGYNRKVQFAGGIVGNLFYAAFGAFQCVKCGKIAQHEFSSDTRKQLMIQSVLMVVGAIALIIFVLFLNTLKS